MLYNYINQNMCDSPPDWLRPTPPPRQRPSLETPAISLVPEQNTKLHHSLFFKAVLYSELIWECFFFFIISNLELHLNYGYTHNAEWQKSRITLNTILRNCKCNFNSIFIFYYYEWSTNITHTQQMWYLLKHYMIHYMINKWNRTIKI